MEVTTTDDDGRRYSDGRWHDVIAVRQRSLGHITLDGRYTGKGVLRSHRRRSRRAGDVAALSWARYLYPSRLPPLSSTRFHRSRGRFCLRVLLGVWLQRSKTQTVVSSGVVSRTIPYGPRVPSRNAFPAKRILCLF